MQILGIDPGTTLSAWVLWDSDSLKVLESLEEYLRRQTTQAQAKARSRLIAQLRTLTGSNLPDDTRAAITLLLEDLNDVS